MPEQRPIADDFVDELLRDFADDADNDSDAISSMFLSPDAAQAVADDPGGCWRPGDPGECHIDGAVVVIKGGEAVRAFEAWAVKNGYVAEKPIRDDHATSAVGYHTRD